MNGRARWLVLVALVLAVLLAAPLLLRGRTGPGQAVAPARPEPAAAPAPPPAPQTLRPVLQRPAVTLSAQPPEAPGRPAPQGAFEGRVVSTPSGAALPGAELTFAQPGAASSVTTGPDGRFRFEPHVAGRWLLAAATAGGHLPFAPEWGQSPVLLEARPGEVVRGLLVTLSPARALDGLVVDPEGRPVAGAEVRILGGGAGATTLVPLKDRFRSGQDGTFRFTAPEDAIVEASREGYARGRARVDASVQVSRRLTVQLKAAGSARLTIDGTVEDQGGSPAEGAAVSALCRANPGEPPASARADATGRFELPGLEGGPCRLIATRTGAAPAALEVEAGARGVHLRLGAGGLLSGRVTDRRTGAAVAPFTVLVQTLEVRSLSVIDGSGRYLLDDLLPGPAVVSVVAPGHAPSAEIRVTIPEPGAPASVVDFELGAGGTLTGVVVDRADGRPIAAALVSVEGASASLAIPVRTEAVADAEGRFTLTGLAEHEVGVTASAPGHHARVIAAPPLAEGERRGPVTLELTPLQPGEEPRVELAGIGARLEKDGDAFLITMVAPGSGAAEVRLVPGDRVVSIGGRAAAPMTFTDAIPLLRGPEGTTVTLGVVRWSDPKGGPITMVVPRRIIRG